MSICEVNGLTPLKNIGSIQSSYDNQFKRSLTTNEYIGKREKLFTEELKKLKDLNVDNDFYRLMQIKEKEINSKAPEKAENELTRPFTESLCETHSAVSKINDFSRSIYDDYNESPGDKAARFYAISNRINPIDDTFNKEDDLIDKIKTYYSHQKNLLDKYSELIADHSNKITSFLMNQNDLNDDGVLSLEEAGKASDKISKADANGDGLIMKEELAASLEKIFLSDQKDIVVKLSDKLNNSFEVPRTMES